MPEQAKPGEKIFRGIPVSTGVCKGKILRLVQPEQRTLCAQTLTEEELPQQVQRLEQALVQTRQQILEVQRKVNEGLGSADASIFDAHLLVLEDPTLIDEVTRCIYKQKVSAEQAFSQVAQKYSTRSAR